MKAKLTFLGTGTSLGVPIIGCKCPVCLSKDPRDKRLRSSVLVEYCGMRILVDSGPDFRYQMLRAGVDRLDAILFTHNHMDHTGGLDDVRAFNYIDLQSMEIFCEEPVLNTLKRMYGYAFAEHKYPGAPMWNVNLISEDPFVIPRRAAGTKLTWIHGVGYGIVHPDGSVTEAGSDMVHKAKTPADYGLPEDLGKKAGFRIEKSIVLDPSEGALIIPIRGYHDKMPVLGFRFGNIAYITDMSSLPDSELEKLQGLDHVTLNTVGYHPHHSHFSLSEAISLAGRIGAKHTWLTHLSHSFPSHPHFAAELKAMTSLPILPAYDGLVIE